jgi:formamidopyrimidine-DNA glycosylase (fpg)
MPELPEVETVKETLKRQVLNRKIIKANIYYENMIEYPTSKEFKEQIKNQVIEDIERRGKWLLFRLTDYYLLSHLRMEGKYFIRDEEEERLKHEHVSFTFDNGKTLRYIDTRKFGKMALYLKEDVLNSKQLINIGLEPFDDDLTVSYLKEKYKKKKLSIKTVLLDQSIIAGIGNIYANEILFVSKINPSKKASELNDKELEKIIESTKVILKNAIEKGGTTIRSYTSSEGVHGLFQDELYVHGKDKEKCPNCNQKIVKITLNGRGTYYCSNCQK